MPPLYILSCSSVLLASLLFLSACLSAAETGFLSLNYYRITHLAKKGHAPAQLLESWLRQPEALLSFILITNNLLNIFISSVAALLGMRLYGDAGSAIAMGGVACCIILFGDILPKTIAARYPEKSAFFALRLLGPVFWISKPLMMLFNGCTQLLLRGIGFSKDSDTLKREFLGKEELLSVINEPGVPIPPHHKEMLKSILTLEEIAVDDIMIPRHEMESLNLDQAFETILAQLQQACHKYVVLYQGTLAQVIGLLRVQTVQYLVFKKKVLDKKILRALTEPLYCIPEKTPLSSQLLEFKSKKLDIGFIVDEYGDIQGLITLADILEETISNLSPAMSGKALAVVRPQTDGSVIVSGMTHLRDLNQKFGWTLPTKGPRTLNGLLLENFLDIPLIGSTITIQQHTIEVLDVRQNRIKWVKIMQTMVKTLPVPFSERENSLAASQQLASGAREPSGLLAGDLS